MIFISLAPFLLWLRPPQYRIRQFVLNNYQQLSGAQKRIRRICDHQYLFFWVSLSLDLDIEVMFAFFVRSKVHSVQGLLSAFITNEVRLVLMWLTPQLWQIIKELFVACFHYRFVVSDIWIHQVPTFRLRVAWEDTWSNRMWKKPFILNHIENTFILNHIENTATKSTNLKMKLWNANIKILRQNERLKPSTTETALPRYFRVRNDDHFWEKKNFWHFPFLIIWVMVKFLLLPESSWRRKGRRGRGRSSTILGLLLSLLSSGMRKTFRLGVIIISHHSFCSRSWSQ